MKNGIYVISDKLTGRYGAVFDSPTDESAKVYLLRRYGTTPDYNDLCLFKTGEVDIETGVTKSLNTIISIKTLTKSENSSKPAIDEIENR